MLTFDKWLLQWLVDSDYEPTEKEIDAMRDAWNGAIQTMQENKEDLDSIPHDLKQCIMPTTQQVSAWRKPKRQQ